MPSSTDAARYNDKLDLSAVAGGSASSSLSPLPLPPPRSLAHADLLACSARYRCSSRPPLRPGRRQRLRHRPQREARRGRRAALQGAGGRGGRRQDVRVHQSRPVVRPLSRTHLSWTSQADACERDRSVSEVRRVAKELERKTGKAGIDFLVTTQGASLSQLHSIHLRVPDAPALLQVVPLTAPTRRPRRPRRTTPTLPSRPCRASASRTSSRRPTRSRTRG